MKPLAIAISLLLSIAVSQGQHLDNPAVDGLLIYKERRYYGDDLAVAVEYTNVTNTPRVTHVFLYHGGYVQLPPDADTLFISYPGRTGETKDEVLPLLDIADTRFPQYHALITRIRNEWKLTIPKKVESASIASESRKSWAQNIIASMSRSVQTLLHPFPATSLDRQSPTPSANTKKDTDTLTTSKPQPENLQENLKKIREYYKQAEEAP